MNLIKFWNKKVKTLEWSDIALIKLTVASATLMIAKLWTPLLSLNWYWYGIIFIITVIKPMHKVYFK